MSLQVVIVLGVVVFVFRIPSKGPILCACLLLLAQNLAGVAFGMLISALCRSTLAAVMLAIFTLFFVILVAGVLWPVAAIPNWFQWFSVIQPNTLPIESLRSILSRGWSWTNPGVWLSGFGMTFLWIVILFGAGILAFRYD